MPRLIALGATFACVVFARCPCALALDATLDASQYVHTAWKTREGFTKGRINTIAQTLDGYLWLGTDLGLVRFDGVRALPWQPPLRQNLPSNQILTLRVARDGTLWIGTDGGLASWKAGRLLRYEGLEGSYVGNLVEDGDGTIWLTSFRTKWILCQIRGAQLTCYGENGGPGADALGLYADRAGTLWVGVWDGVWRWKPGRPTFFPLGAEKNGIHGLADGANGTLLLVRGGAIRRLLDGREVLAYRLPSTIRQSPIDILLRDRHGTLWAGTTSQGLVHVHDGVVDTFSALDGLSGDGIAAIFEDREGAIWVATADGLDRFRESAVVPYGVRQGLSKRPMSVLSSADGSIWVGGPGGLARRRHRQVTRYQSAASIASIAQDARRRVWLSSPDGIGYLENDDYVAVKNVSGGTTRAIVEDGQKALWIVNPLDGLFRVDPRTGAIERFARALFNPQDLVSAAAADPATVGVWVGYLHGGIAHFAGGQVRQSYDASSGLAGGRVSSLYVDSNGALWAAQDRGLSRLRNGRLATLTSENGLPCDAAGWVIEDASRSLWVGMACGLVRLERAAIDAWSAAVDAPAAGTVTSRRQVSRTVFDQLDGMRSLIGASYYTSPVARAADGKLWFLSADGVSVVDPAHLPTNSVPPPVHIERVTADRKSYGTDFEPGDRVRLPALVRDLQIDYTALSLAVPEKMRFRYTLEGHDADWQDVGTRRQAFYTDLSPGSYRFRVTASNDSGVWNEAGTYLDLSVAPAFYQTGWFVTLAAGLVIAATWGGHRLRLGIVEKHEREVSALNERLMKAQEQERMRIAGELHDGVAQEMLAATMMLGTARRRMPDDSPAKATIDRVQEKLIQVGADIRQMSHDLHPPILQEAGLPEAVRTYCEQFGAGAGIKVSCEADEAVRELSRGAALALYRLMQEALGNAAKHAAARHVGVLLTRSNGQVTLEVRDDGAGFDRDALAVSSGLGLITMRERATQLGGTFEFETASGHGTTIRAVIPFR